MMTRGQKIKQLRESKGISQTYFAKSVGVSKQSLYKYENDIITNIPSDVIERISENLGCSPAYIMGWSEINQDFSETLSDLTPDQLKRVMEYARFVKSERENQS